MADHRPPLAGTAPGGTKPRLVTKTSFGSFNGGI